MTHIRRGRTIQKRYRNGLLSKEEEYLVRLRVMLAMDFDIDREIYERLEAAVSPAMRT